MQQCRHAIKERRAAAKKVAITISDEKEKDKDGSSTTDENSQDLDLVVEVDAAKKQPVEVTEIVQDKEELAKKQYDEQIAKMKKL
jgi:hypothetical protein